MIRELKGWYAKPHKLINLVRSGEITKSEFIFLDIIFHLHSLFARKKTTSFFHTDVNIAKMRLLSEPVIREVRKSLARKGYIQYKEGRPGKATEYKLMIEEDDYQFKRT